MLRLPIFLFRVREAATLPKQPYLEKDVWYCLYRAAREIILLLVLLIGSMSYAAAGSVETFDLHDVAWHVPAEFVSVPPTQTGGARSFALRYELPNFSAVNWADFKGVYPEDDRPVLTVEVSYDQNSPDPTELLNKYIAEAEKDCPSCTNSPSSVGGMEYDTFFGQMGPGPYSPDGALFRLYKYPNTNGQFSICHFGADLAPLQCEMIQKIRANLVLTIDFPIEYVTEGPDLISHAIMLLDRYQLNDKQTAVNADSQINAKPTCWHPAAGTEGAKTIPLKIGPETWHIPRAYASTFGLNQTSDPKYDSISFWLKLPDLEPLLTTDPSPIAIKGRGNYISIMMGYDPADWSDPSKTEFLPKLIKSGNFIGKNAFTNYDEYQRANSKTALKYLYRDVSIDFVSNNAMSNASLFPPWWFQCSQYGGAPGPSCQFQVSEIEYKNKETRREIGRYDIEYSFSRDYFSQLIAINACMQKLYESFRYNKTD
jgi:hypothetical protein